MRNGGLTIRISESVPSAGIWLRRLGAAIGWSAGAVGRGFAGCAWRFGTRGDDVGARERGLWGLHGRSEGGW